MCDKRGPQLGPDDELFHRQVNPEWMDDGVPTSQAFYPWRDIDACCLSVDRASRVTAAAAFRLFTAPRPTGFGMASDGVWPLARQEIESEALTVWEDEEPATYREGIALSPTKAGKADAAPPAAGPAVVPRCVFWEDGEHCFSDQKWNFETSSVVDREESVTDSKYGLNPRWTRVKSCACGAMAPARQTADNR